MQLCTVVKSLSPSNNESKCSRKLCYSKISFIVLVPGMSIPTYLPTYLLTYLLTRIRREKHYVKVGRRWRYWLFDSSKFWNSKSVNKLHHDRSLPIEFDNNGAVFFAKYNSKNSSVHLFVLSMCGPGLEFQISTSTFFDLVVDIYAVISLPTGLRKEQR